MKRKKHLALISFTLIQFSIHPSSADTLGEPYESEARATVDVLLSQKDDLSVLKRVYRAHIKKVRSLSERLLTECEVFPSDCTVGNVLLFRGQPKVTMPGVSGLVRSRWENSSYAQGKDLPGMLEQLKQDVRPLRKISGAFSDERRDRLILISGKNSNQNTWLQENDPSIDEDGNQLPLRRIPYDTSGPRGPGKRDQELNTKQILFTFHAEWFPLFFDDPISKKEMLLDPLISFSSDLTQAAVFAVGNPQPNATHKSGHLILISVPRSKISNLCSKKPENLKLAPGEIWETQSCSEYLNSHDDEREFDVLGYIPRKYIRGSFFLEWKDIEKEIQVR